MKGFLGSDEQEHSVKILQVLEDQGVAADRLNQSNRCTLMKNLWFTVFKKKFKTFFFNKTNKQKTTLIEFLLGWKSFVFISLLLSR